MALLISASASVAATCADDPNECTLKKLCEVATTVDGDNTTWSTTTGSAKHVSTAQSLGMECGITPIVDLCDTDPSECKLSQICSKATTDNAGKKSWDDSAAAYVATAKEYGLSCDVSEKTVAQEIADDNQQACSLSALEACTNTKLCEITTFGATGLVKWSKISIKREAVTEAKKRGLTCGVKAKTAAVTKSCSQLTPEGCNASFVCAEATISSGNKKIWRIAHVNHQWTVFLKEAKKRGLSCGVSEAKATNFKRAFTSQSRLRRKQLQYALKKLGYYSYGTDGLWGKGTSSGFDKFMNDYNLENYTEAQVFNSLLNKVSVPSSFAAPKRKVITTTTPAKTTQDTAGLTAIISNPSVTGRQAMAICGPQARLAKSQASAGAASGSSNRRKTYDVDCSYGSCRARDVTPSGGMWGGILKGLTEGMAGKRAYDGVMDSCLAQYGWSD